MQLSDGLKVYNFWSSTEYNIIYQIRLIIFGVKIKLLIRQFNTTDLDEVYNIERKSFNSPWSRFSLIRFHQNNPQGFFVADMDAVVVGYAIVEVDKYVVLGFRRRGHLINLAVDPQFRRQGVGTTLMKFILLYLKKEKVDDVWLEVRESNSVARKFYNKLGFREIGQSFLYYPNEDAVIMSLKIK